MKDLDASQAISARLDTERGELAIANERAQAVIANLECRLAEQQTARSKLETALRRYTKNTFWLDRFLTEIVKTVNAMEQRRGELARSNHQ